jgi:hypothetical protein
MAAKGTSWWAIAANTVSRTRVSKVDTSGLPVRSKRNAMISSVEPMSGSSLQ